MVNEQIIAVIPEGLEQAISVFAEGREQMIIVSPELEVAKIMRPLSVTPTNEAQVFLPDPGVDGFSRVEVDAIPSNYGLITWDGSVLTVS